MVTLNISVFIEKAVLKRRHLDSKARQANTITGVVGIVDQVHIDAS